MCSDCLGKPDREQYVRRIFVVKLIKRFFFYLFYLKFRDCFVRVYKSVRKCLDHTAFCIILPGVTVQYTRGNAVHCGASVRKLYDALVFHSTTYYHLHTSHITSFPGLPHLQLLSVKLQTENAWGRGYE